MYLGVLWKCSLVLGQHLPVLGTVALFGILLPWFWALFLVLRWWFIVLGHCLLSEGTIPCFVIFFYLSLKEISLKQTSPSSTILVSEVCAETSLEESKHCSVTC